jgi:hypothetical protein
MHPSAVPAVIVTPKAAPRTQLRVIKGAAGPRPDLTFSHPLPKDGIGANVQQVEAVGC